MGDVLFRLARLDRLRGLDLELLRPVAQYWRVATLEPGTLLWKQGRTMDGVGFVLGGELSVLVDGLVVARVRPGELVGDLATAVPRGAQSCTARADTSVEVALLPAAAQLSLRAHDLAAMEALTRHALRQITARTVEIYAETAMLRDGALARHVRDPQGRSGQVRPSRRPDTPPAVVPLLSRLEPLQRAGEHAIVTLAAALSPIRTCAGDVVSRAGEADDRAFLVVDGAFNLLLHRRTGQPAALVAQVGPPALLGAEALVGVVTRATAVAAASSGWLFALDAAGCERLPRSVRLAWIESGLASATALLRDALRALGASLDAFSREHPEGTTSRAGMTASDSMSALLRGWSERSGAELERPGRP